MTLEPPQQITEKDLEFRYSIHSYLNKWGRWTDFLIDIGERCQYRGLLKHDLEHYKEVYLNLEKELGHMPGLDLYRKRLLTDGSSFAYLTKQFGSWIKFRQSIDRINYKPTKQDLINYYKGIIKTPPVPTRMSLKKPKYTYHYHWIDKYWNTYRDFIRDLGVSDCKCKFPYWTVQQVEEDYHNAERILKHPPSSNDWTRLYRNKELRMPYTRAVPLFGSWLKLVLHMGDEPEYWPNKMERKKWTWDTIRERYFSLKLKHKSKRDEPVLRYSFFVRENNHGIRTFMNKNHLEWRDVLKELGEPTEIIRNCLVCGKSITIPVSISHVRMDKTTCSQHCFYKQHYPRWRIKSLRKSRQRYRKTHPRLITFVCANPECAKNVRKHNKPGLRYCSAKCRDKNGVRLAGIAYLARMKNFKDSIKNSDLIDCACGCGKRIRHFDIHNREHRYFPGHNAKGTKARRVKQTEIETAYKKLANKLGHPYIEARDWEKEYGQNRIFRRITRLGGFADIRKRLGITGQLETHCLQCDKIFVGRFKFCSRSCNHRYYYLHYDTKKNPRLMGAEEMIKQTRETGEQLTKENKI